MQSTRTGGFPIGFRTGGGAWQADLAQLGRWAAGNGFAAIDVGAVEPDQVRAMTDTGLRIGSIDLKQPWSDLISPDAGKRRAAADVNAEYISRVVPLGARCFFTVLLPEEPARDRAENFGFAVDGYGRLAAAIAATGARIVIEGWPGGGPHYPALGCTPETCRALFREIGSDAMGLNFDPSHLVRMGIDPVRFLGEFVARVHHVHGKDTAILEEGLYESGNLQEPVFTPRHGYGSACWRYTIPGHGIAPWGRLLAILADAGYGGLVSIELEDENFNGSEEGEKRGLIASRDFLVHV